MRRGKCFPFFSLRWYSSCERRSHFSFSQTLRPPVPKKIPSTVSAHGATWHDPYRWMCNTNNPDLSDYLARENTYAGAFMADTADLRQALEAEMKSRIPSSKVSTPPERWGQWLYYQYIPEGKEYPILCRRLTSCNGVVKSFFNYTRRFPKEELLLDWNLIAEQHGYVHIGICRVSPDHKYLAYTLDTSGRELFTLHVKDLGSGQTVSHKTVGVVSLAWSRTSNFLVYTVCDETQRPNRVLCKELGSDVEDNVLFVERGQGICVDVANTKDRNFITINSNSRSSSEVYVMDSTNIKDGLCLVRKREPGVQYFVEHHYGVFYVLTNAPLNNMESVTEGYYLTRCSAEKPLMAKWKDIILPGEDSIFCDMDIFHGHLVLSVEKKGHSLFCSIKMPIENTNKELVSLDDLNPWFFPVPSSLCTIVAGSNNDFASSTYRTVISSPVIPDIVVDYDMKEQKYAVVHQDEVNGLSTETKANFYANSWSPDSSSVRCQSDENWRRDDSQTWRDLSTSFTCMRREVISHDNVKIPLTIIHSKELECTGHSPGLLYGYGAYGEVLDKSWCSEHVSLLNRGWLLAYADVRGGGDASWHQAGSKLHKLNSIEDFAACGKYLVNEGYVHRNRLGAVGCSAGGLLVAATINKYPHLFGATILKVPFLDICNTMLDPSLPLTVLDYDEFGHPGNKAEFENIRSYSPYDNITAGICYPPMLVMASFHDSRVGVWEAAKWVARIREQTCDTCSKLVILKTDMAGGHFADSGRYRHCEDVAFEYAFLIKAMGMLS